jgi:uncharacterized protein YecE (DUF72 family)
LTAVEGNTTFYSTPSAETVRRWHDETPAGFQFCPKLPRYVTHPNPDSRIAPQLEPAIAFLQLMQGLGDRLGPCFAQLPPSYGPQQLQDLAQFLAGWPTHAPLCVEVRHPDWFREPYEAQLTALLRSHSVGRVLLDTRPIYNSPDDPQVHSERKKPPVPLHAITTSDRVLIRYISHPDPDRNRDYLSEWVQFVAQWLQQGKQVYFFAHCPIEARSPQLANTFQRLLETAGVDVPPLPWNAIAPSQQLTLF